MLGRNILALSALFLLSVTSQSEVLPTLNEEPFFGCYAGAKTRGAVFQFGDDGVVRIVMVNKGVLSHVKSVNLRFFIQEEIKGKKIMREVKNDGFTFTEKAMLDVKSVKYGATFSNEAKVDVEFIFKGEALYFNVDLIDKGKAKGDLKYGFDANIPLTYKRMTAESEREWKKKTKGAGLVIDTAAKKRIKEKLYVGVNDFMEEHGEKLKDGINFIEVSARDFAGKNLEFGRREKSGADMHVKFKASDRLFKGGTVRWLVDPAKKGSGPIGYVKIAK